MELVWVWAIAFLFLIIGAWVQTAIGFGMAVVSAPVLVIIAPSWTPYVTTTSALVLSLFNAWDQRQHHQLKSMSAAFITRIPGTMLGLWLLMNISMFWLQVSIIFAVMLAVALSYSSMHFEANGRRLAVASFFSGCLGTTTSIGGPPMALVMQHGAAQTVRANLSIYFLYACCMSLASYVWGGLMSPELWWLCLSFIPASFLGFYFGRKTQRWVDAKRFRPLLLGFCGFSALLALLSLVVKSLA